MKFLAKVNVMPLKALLDPQGKAVGMTMQNTGFIEASNVRIGKHITFEIDANNREAALVRVNEICTAMLANPVMEGYDYQVSELK
jgi:phosphoribosylformylglycinamidine synthase subunit PurS